MSIPDFYTEEKEKHRIREITRWITDIIVVLSMVCIAGVFFFGRIQVQGRSMEPVLSDGDIVFLDRAGYTFTDPQRLDIISFQKTDASGVTRTYIKRILGLPGERIRISDGRIYINDIAIDLEDGLSDVILAGMANQDILLSEDEYFVLGDNRDSSEDSRFETIGNVKRSEIMGKIWFRIRPIDSMGFV